LEADAPAPFECPPCQYFAAGAATGEPQQVPAPAGAIRVTTTAGFGATGNIYRSLRNAMRRAHACKTMLALPAEDTKGGAFRPANGTRLFDFGARPGAAHPSCGRRDVGGGLVGNAGAFWALPDLENATPEQAEWHFKYDREPAAQDACLRRYIGACDPGWCEGMDLGQTLVVHLRQGDIFPANFGSAECCTAYGQPPLQYFVRAMAWARWREVLVVGLRSQRGTGPVWAQLEALSRAGLLAVPVRFQSSRAWADDFRTLMCAANLVESRSTVRQVLQLGRARRFFTWGCFDASAPGMEVYEVAVGEEYAPFNSHTNSAEQWVAALLHPAAPPRRCRPGDAPEAPRDLFD
jgi:hypothetical protein